MLSQFRRRPFRGLPARGDFRLALEGEVFRDVLIAVSPLPRPKEKKRRGNRSDLAGVRAAVP